MNRPTDLHRKHAEEFLRWLGIQTNQQTGAPLSVSLRRTLITRVVTETAAWGWDDVPARVLFTRVAIPKIASWLQTDVLKTELELGHCLRTPAEGPCECDPVLTCSKFLTTSDYAPRLRSRLEVEKQLIHDARARGWPREIERHEATKRRLEQFLHDLA